MSGSAKGYTYTIHYMVRVWQGDRYVRHFQWEHRDESQPFQDMTERYDYDGSRFCSSALFCLTASTTTSAGSACPLLPVLHFCKCSAVFCKTQVPIRPAFCKIRRKARFLQTSSAVRCCMQNDQSLCTTTRFYSWYGAVLIICSTGYFA